jgi:cytidine deaminase
MMAFEPVKYEDLPIGYKMTLDAATKAMHERPYQPYSRFSVGAAVLAKDGTIIAGTNFENASYGLTICAERSTIFTANNLGKRVLEAIAINAKGEGFDCTDITGPCGACRQVIYEASHLSGKDLDVIMATTKLDKIVIARISELLPLAFGPRDLGVDLAKYRT